MYSVDKDLMRQNPALPYFKEQLHVVLVFVTLENVISLSAPFGIVE
jgi:hypothetical protein